jgi:hypothetical protein
MLSHRAFCIWERVWRVFVETYKSISSLFMLVTYSVMGVLCQGYWSDGRCVLTR